MSIKISVVFLVLFFSLSIFSQEKADIKDERIVKGQQIIENARKEIGIDQLISNLNSFQVSIKSISDLVEFVAVNTKEISIMLPGRIRSGYSTEKPSESKTTSIWNGGNYKKLLEFVAFDGRRDVQDVTNRELNGNLSKFVKDPATLEKIKKAKSINPKERLNNDLWSEVFPLILIHPFDKQAEFRYVGKAESPTGTANVVDTTTESGRSIRLLFDSKTNYLLSMIEKYKSFDGDYEIKYYYSNRLSVDNVLIPKKIKVEYKFTPTGKETRLTYNYNDVLEFKLNPKFKPNLFDVN